MYNLLQLLYILALTALFCKRGHPLRESLLYGLLLWGVTLVAITESLSLGGMLNLGGVASMWTAALVIAALIYIKTERPSDSSTSAAPPPATLYEGTVGEVVSEGGDKGGGYLYSILASIPIVVILGVTLLIAIKSPPNTWDSLTYHMPRIMHWLQNGTVAHYPTTIIRQLYQPPFAEFAIMHTTVLSGGDTLANIIQWAAMAASLVGVSLIGKELGLGRCGQSLSALICATIPMGILQSTSTQNDYVISLWLVILALLTLKITKSESYSWKLAVLTAFAIGLGVLTKGTGYLYATPFIVWIIVWGVRNLKGGVLRPIILVTAIFLLINGGHLWRNHSMYEAAPETPHFSEQYRNESHGLKDIISNIITNLGLHMSTPIPSLNRFLDGGIERIHSIIGADIKDPETTWKGNEFSLITLESGKGKGQSYFAIPLNLGPASTKIIVASHEDTAGNPLHLLLLLSAALIILLDLKRPEGGGKGVLLIPYLLTLLGCGLLYALLLKWQIWGSRLHLPIFVLASPFISAAITDRYKRFIPALTALLLTIYSIPFLVLNQVRPIGIEPKVITTEREDLYYTNDMTLKDIYQAAGDVANKLRCNNIGLVIGSSSLEYPIWVSMEGVGGRGNFGKNFTIEHYNVPNPSAGLPRREGSKRPCLVISTSKRGSLNLEDAEGTARYRFLFNSDPIYYYVPDMSRG